jgi:hypothetical protein
MDTMFCADCLLGEIEQAAPLWCAAGKHGPWPHIEVARALGAPLRHRSQELSIEVNPGHA